MKIYSRRAIHFYRTYQRTQETNENEISEWQTLMIAQK